MCQRDGFRDRQQVSPEGFAALPADGGDFVGERAGRRGILAGGDADGDAVVGRVGEDEAAENRDVEDRAGVFRLAALSKSIIVP